MSKWSQIPGVVRAMIVFFASFCIVTLALLWYARTPAFDESEPPPSPKVNHKEPFKWSDAIPHLYQAAALPPKEAVRVLLQNSVHLRTYVAIELISASKPEDPFRNAELGEPILENAITPKVDEMIAKRIRSEGSLTSVDCVLSRQPFPFTVITALKSHTHPYASLVFDLTEGSGVSARSIKAEYGLPLERTTDPLDGESLLMKYRTETKSYTATTVFKLNARSEQGRSVTVSVQRRTRK